MLLLGVDALLGNLTPSLPYFITSTCACCLPCSMSGDVVELPVGGTIRKKTNAQARQAEMTRLSTLADVLGMQPQVGRLTALNSYFL